MRSTDSTANVGNEVHLQRDVELVSAVLAGSEWAFADIHRLYAHSLYRTIFTITKNHEDAEDVLQETMLRAYLALDSFEGRSKLISWLTRIAINSALMTLRKRRVRHEAHFEALGEVAEETSALELRDSRPNPEEACLQLERRCSVLYSVNKLEPPLRAVIQLYMSKDGSMKELAQSLDVTVAAVKAKLHRARRRLALRTHNEAGISHINLLATISSQDGRKSEKLKLFH